MWGISVNCPYTKLNGAVNFRLGRGLRFAAGDAVQAQLLKRKALLVFLSTKTSSTSVTCAKIES